jgi:hypothetical protein
MAENMLTTVFSALVGRYDKLGEDFSRTTQYITKCNSSEDCDIQRITYSNRPVQGRTYRTTPTSEGRTSEEGWNIDESLTRNTQTYSSVLSSLNATGAQSGCYVTTYIDPAIKLGGASLGFALAMAVAGFNVDNGGDRIVFTGWLTDYGLEKGDSYIGPVEAIDAKARYCCKIGKILFLPTEALKGVPEMLRWYEARQKIYDYCWFRSGVPFSYDLFCCVAINNLSEAEMLGLAFSFAPRKMLQRKRDRTVSSAGSLLR